MASKTTTSVALFFCLNLLFFSLVTACGTCTKPHPRRRPRPSPGSGPGTSPGTNPGTGPGTNPGNGPGTGPGTNPGNGTPGTNPGNGPGTNPGNGNPGTNPGNGTPGTGSGTCPRDALKIGACANLLNLVNLTIGNPPVTPCCTLIQGLADLEAAVCLCTAIRASILVINLNLPINLSLLLNVCSRNAPRGFQCP